MSLDGAVAVVVVQPHLGARLRRVKGRRDVGVGPARRFEVVADVGEGVALRQGCSAGVLAWSVAALLSLYFGAAVVGDCIHCGWSLC